MHTLPPGDAPAKRSRASIPSNVIRLPTAAKREVRTPFLTGDQLATRGIRRILPEAFPSAKLRSDVPPFDPTNPSHLRAWEGVYDMGLAMKRLAAREGKD